MVRVIMEDAGAGKTKQLIDLINQAVTVENGTVVCIEPKRELTYNINYNIRLVAANEYDINGFDGFKGFLCGMYAGNFDITHIFVDNLCKVCHDSDLGNVESFLNWLESFSEKNGIKFTITLSVRADEATDGIKQYF